MTAPLDSLLPVPRLAEVHSTEVPAPPDAVWQRLRHEPLSMSPLVRALFAVRDLPLRLRGDAPPPFTFRLSELENPEVPGFRIYAEDAPHHVVVGAIGDVFSPEITFQDVPDADAYRAFAEPGQVKVAWAFELSPSDEGTLVRLEVRVDATDDDAWERFRRYFRIIGVGSRFIRRTALRELRRHFSEEAAPERRALPGDDRLPDAYGSITDVVDIDAPPDAVWPWLVQMGCRRAGFYSVDLLDNGGVRSAREIHPEWQSLAVGEVLAATPEGDDGFEVLAIDPPHTLLLGGLFEPGVGQHPFAATRPETFWHVTWVFHLEPRGAAGSRLFVRVRAAFPEGDLASRWHLSWVRPAHALMEHAQLAGLKARAEGTLPRSDWRDVLEGIGGAAIMAAALATPFLRARRSHWGLSTELADRAYPGDDHIPDPRWMWTHGVTIDAPAAEVWPWVAQLGADRAGFYSYQWLENLVGCRIRNAERIHPEWALAEGDALKLHPDSPEMDLTVVDVAPGRHLLAVGGLEPEPGRTWVKVSWLFHLEPLDGDRCRLISRYRAASSDDLATRASFGPTLVEPIGFAMDRRMLLGIAERARRATREASTP